MLWTTIGVAFALALSILALGIYFIHQTEEDNELRAYRNAMLSTEPAVLQNFLDIYADASEEHRDSIKAHLEVLKKVDRDWKNAVASKSRSALLQFVERNPHNVHIPEARLIIDSLDFDVARVENTMEAYQKYMNEHQQGSYYDEAASAFDRLKIEADARREKAIQDSIMASQGHTDHSDAPDEDQPLLYE